MSAWYPRQETDLRIFTSFYISKVGSVLVWVCVWKLFLQTSVYLEHAHPLKGLEKEKQNLYMTSQSYFVICEDTMGKIAYFAQFPNSMSTNIPYVYETHSHGKKQ